MRTHNARCCFRPAVMPHMHCCSCPKPPSYGHVLCTLRSKDAVPAAVRAGISSVEASLTMFPALTHLHMPHTAALTALHVGLAADRAGECKLCVTGFFVGSFTGAAVAIAWHERQKLPDCKGDLVHIKARLGGVAMPRATQIAGAMPCQNQG